MSQFQMQDPNTTRKGVDVDCQPDAQRLGFANKDLPFGGRMLQPGMFAGAACTVLVLLMMALGDLFLGAESVLAAPSFTSSYHTTYDFSEDGSAQVVQEVTLINHTTDRYPADYNFTLKNLRPQDVSAVDGLGVLPTEVVFDQNQNLTTLRVHFNQKALGIGARLDWHLEFKIPHLAQKNGRLWETVIPLLSGSEELDGYQVVIKVPKKFGRRLFFKPAQIKEAGEEGDKYIYHFDAGAKLSTPGLSFSFGDFQLYDFELAYHLYNSGDQKALMEIALPPNFYPYQKVYLKSLEPKPVSLRQDPDDNYLASYELRPKQKLDIVYTGQVKVSLASASSALQPPPSNLQSYLLPAKYWEVNDEKIRKQRLKIQAKYNLKEVSSSFDRAKAFYDYVTTTLHYNPGRITKDIKRLGALGALQDPQEAVCMEYTDLLITLLRNAGIPARELDGFAMTQNDPDKPTLSDTLHAWVQFFDPPEADRALSPPKEHESDFVGWRNVDPTWGSTTGIDYFGTLGTSHIIFVIKGLDSEHPYPAGSYKITGQEQNDVQIKYAEKFQAGIRPFRLWWQQEYELSRMTMVEKALLRLGDRFLRR